MNRDYRFDVARAACMMYVIFIHLYDYTFNVKVGTAFVDFPVLSPIGDACMGLFTFISGYLLGSKYIFGKQRKEKVSEFYKKRILRIIPLFVLSAVVLWLIGLNVSLR